MSRKGSSFRSRYETDDSLRKYPSTAQLAHYLLDASISFAVERIVVCTSAKWGAVVSSNAASHFAIFGFPPSTLSRSASSSIWNDPWHDFNNEAALPKITRRFWKEWKLLQTNIRWGLFSLFKWSGFVERMGSRSFHLHKFAWLRSRGVHRRWRAERHQAGKILLRSDTTPPRSSRTWA